MTTRPVASSPGSSSGNSRAASLIEMPLDRAVSLDETCDRFEAGVRSGQQPRIEDFLAEQPPEERGVLLRELLQLEIQIRLRNARGDTVILDDYRRRFPGYEHEVDRAVRDTGSSSPLHEERLPVSSAAELAAGSRSTNPPLVLPCPFGAYELQAEIGHGGMGTVYRGTHRALDRAVAIKLMRPERQLSSESIVRFEREMRAVAKLHHTNIVMAYDAGDIAGLRYLAMEFVTGWDLSSVCRCCGTLPIPVACECVRQAALGLQHVYEHGLVHRDIKPSNLMLTEQGAVKLLDLGLARLREDEREEQLTHESCPMGTLEYIAPEQARNPHAVDIRADLYSLGCTLFKLLCGFAPFGRLSQTSVQLLAAHLTEKPPLLREHRPEAPAALEELVAELLNKQPADRPQTPNEVIDALKRFSSESALAAFAGALRTMSDESGVLPKDVAAAVKLDTQSWQAEESTNRDEPAEPPAQQPPIGPRGFWPSCRMRQWLTAASVIGVAIAGLCLGLHERTSSRNLLESFDLSQNHIAGYWQTEPDALYSPLPGTGVGCVRLVGTPHSDFHLELTAQRQDGLARWMIVNTGAPEFAIAFTPRAHAAGEAAERETADDPARRSWAGQWGDITNSERRFDVIVRRRRLILQRDGDTVLNVELQQTGRLEVSELPERTREVPGIYLLTIDSRFGFRNIRLTSGGG